MIRLKTDRLSVRDFIPNDAHLVYEYHRENGIKKELPDEVFESLEFTQKLLRQFIENCRSFAYPLVYAVARSEDNLLIGHIGLSEISEDKIEIGYAISEKFQKKGYAKEIIRPFSEWAKVNVGINEIYAAVKSSNIASCKVVEYSGFEFLKEEVKDLFGETDIRVKTYIYR